MIILFLVIEPIKRTISALLYPFAYTARHSIRSNVLMDIEFLTKMSMRIIREIIH
jgi:hypothetical protein